MQEDALQKIYKMEADVMGSDDQDIIRDWRKMQTSDHFYYMCTKFFSDGDVHKYFNPYESPYEAFINYMNTLNDLKMRTKKAVSKKKRLNRQPALKASGTKAKSSPKKRVKSK
jgi:alpha-amylase